VWSKLVKVQAPIFVSMTHLLSITTYDGFRNTRVEVCPPAYNEDILEDPANFEDLSKQQYNKQVREGLGVPTAPIINYVVKCSLLYFLVGCIAHV
jgi:hypothetical protein